MLDSFKSIPSVNAHVNSHESADLALREQLANNEVAQYEFGEGVNVVGQSVWDKNDKNDFVKSIFVEFDDEPTQASSKVSFHARFSGGVDGSSVEIAEAYGLMCSNGGLIGVRGK